MCNWCGSIDFRSKDGGLFMKLENPKYVQLKNEKRSKREENIAKLLGYAMIALILIVIIYFLIRDFP